MIRVTTPTFVFTLPFEVVELRSYLVTFAQNGRKILDKTEADCKAEGSEITVELTQEETKLFKAQFNLQIQLRVLTNGGDALATEIFTRPVGEVLNDGIMS